MFNFNNDKMKCRIGLVSCDRLKNKLQVNSFVANGSNLNINLLIDKFIYNKLLT